jgi:hypothetical protein
VRPSDIALFVCLFLLLCLSVRKCTYNRKKKQKQKCFMLSCRFQMRLTEVYKPSCPPIFLSLRSSLSLINKRKLTFCCVDVRISLCTIHVALSQHTSTRIFEYKQSGVLECGCDSVPHLHRPTASLVSSCFPSTHIYMKRKKLDLIFGSIYSNVHVRASDSSARTYTHREEKRED